MSRVAALFRDDKDIPDYVAPIIGFRMWTFDGPSWRPGALNHLISLNGERWYPGKPMTAICRASGYPGIRRSGILKACKAYLRPHQAPHQKCSCGIYAIKLPPSRRVALGMVSGEVYLWGKVVEHERGWRSQFAYPKTIKVQLEMLRKSSREQLALLAALTVYGADVLVSRGEEDTLLWTKRFGYTKEGQKVNCWVPNFATSGLAAG
jgi:hypothetical protein